MLNRAQTSSPSAFSLGMEGLKRGEPAELSISPGRAHRLVKILGADLMPQSTVFHFPKFDFLIPLCLLNMFSLLSSFVNIWNTVILFALMPLSTNFIICGILGQFQLTQIGCIFCFFVYLVVLNLMLAIVNIILLGARYFCISVSLSFVLRHS